jgi:two-component system chemotaxis response regulator CheB
MPPRRQHIVVIGASAGGVETLQRVVRGLPPDLPATICIVLHLHPGSPSALAAILRRATELPCRTAVDEEELRVGEILVAPPNRHLAIEGNHVSLTTDPPDSGHRPSVDVLFRSAAAAHGGHVVGVVLSGTRDDGTAGLAVIKANGGRTIVQDPEEARYAGMPANAIAHVDVDVVVPSDQIADAIVKMVNGESPPTVNPPKTAA